MHDIFSEEDDDSEVMDDNEERWLPWRELMCASMSGNAWRDDLRGGCEVKFDGDARDELGERESVTLPEELDEIMDDAEERWLLGRELMCASVSGNAWKDDLQGEVKVNIDFFDGDVRDQLGERESAALSDEVDDAMDDAEERRLPGRELMCASISGNARNDELRSGIKANFDGDVQVGVRESLPEERDEVMDDTEERWLPTLPGRGLIRASTSGNAWRDDLRSGFKVNFDEDVRGEIGLRESVTLPEEGYLVVGEGRGDGHGDGEGNDGEGSDGERSDGERSDGRRNDGGGSDSCGGRRLLGRKVGARKGSGSDGETDADSGSRDVGVNDDSDEKDSILDESPVTEAGVDIDRCPKEADDVSDHVNDKGSKGVN